MNGILSNAPLSASLAVMLLPFFVPEWQVIQMLEWPTSGFV